MVLAVTTTSEMMRALPLNALAVASYLAQRHRRMARRPPDICEQVEGTAGVFTSINQVSNC
jgi:hypothetical protein